MSRSVARARFNELPDRIRVQFQEEGFRFKDFTCAECKDVARCQSAFDAYNIDGDCIEDK